MGGRLGGEMPNNRAFGPRNVMNNRGVVRTRIRLGISLIVLAVVLVQEAKCCHVLLWESCSIVRGSCACFVGVGRPGGGDALNWELVLLWCQQLMMIF